MVWLWVKTLARSETRDLGDFLYCVCVCARVCATLSCLFVFVLLPLFVSVSVFVFVCISGVSIHLLWWITIHDVVVVFVLI